MHSVCIVYRCACACACACAYVVKVYVTCTKGDRCNGTCACATQVIAFSTQVHNIGCGPFVIGVPSGYEPGSALHMRHNALRMACAYVHEVHDCSKQHRGYIMEHSLLVYVHSQFDVIGNACPPFSACQGGRRLSSDEPYAPPRRGQQNLSRGGAQPTGGYTSRRRLDNVRYLGMA